MGGTVSDRWPTALLWDVDGTLAETELQGHRLAFNRAFAEAGLDWHWDPSTYRTLLAISGGLERMRHFALTVEGLEPDPDRIAALQRSKQGHYRQLVLAGEVQLRPGVARLMGEAAAAGLVQAIVTTSGRIAVEALLQQLLPELRSQLALLVCGEDVARKKPDPQAYRRALELLDLAPGDCVAIEDSPQGLASATGAGIATLVTQSLATAEQPRAAFAGSAALVAHLGDANDPSLVLHGPPCPGGLISLGYLHQLLQP
jgi:HAD superfamily hydrolase (TIGR01509 family)